MYIIKVENNTPSVNIPAAFYKYNKNSQFVNKTVEYKKLCDISF